MSIEDRLNRVEQSLKRWKFGALGLVVALFLGADFSAKVAEFDTVRCNRIQLLENSMTFVDKNGDFMGAFGSDGGFACRQLNVITADKKDVCSISSRPNGEGGYDSSLYLYTPKKMSYWFGGDSFVRSLDRK
jgi:hypothetical protein